MKIKVIKFRYQRRAGDYKSKKAWHKTNRYAMEELSKNAQEFLAKWFAQHDNSKLQ